MLRQIALLGAIASSAAFAQNQHIEHDRNNYVQWLEPTEVQHVIDKLPNISDKRIHDAIRAKSTMWYDEESMVFAYQDSVEIVVGLRANSVGRTTGENSSVPDIRKLMNYFGPDKRFRFPFRTAAGTDEAIDSVKVINFWVPAKKDGKVLPVRWWKASARGRWHWLHPVGTVFGEVLMLKAPNGEQHVFEIRIRERYLQGWDVNVFRPFQNSDQLVEAIQERRPNWESNTALKRVVDHLQNPQTLSAFDLKATKELEPSFPTVSGALDYIPDFQDNDLVRSLLTQTTFKTVEGRIWRENDRYETYAASTKASFSIVPRNYTLGVIPVNEASCNRCHEQTGRALRDFDSRVMLYGEIWGEDKIFTWHLFKVNRNMYGTFDDSDGSRFINPRLVKAGLVKEGRPSSSSLEYRQINKWDLPD